MVLEKLDFLSSEPNVLSVGNSKRRKKNNASKNSCGGLLFLFYLFITIVYLIVMFIPLTSGTKNTIESNTFAYQADVTEAASYEDMQIIPTVWISSLSQSNSVLNTTNQWYQKHIFIGTVYSSGSPEKGDYKFEHEQFERCKYI
jgi:magnesium-transporting ATPase (P-type)